MDISFVKLSNAVADLIERWVWEQDARERLESIGITIDGFFPKESLLDTALDLLGVPADNSSELEKLYGQAAIDRPEFCCRDSYWDRVYDAVKEGRVVSFLVSELIDESITCGWLPPEQDL